ncbi:MAG: DUF1343 domain-containing protein [Rikenellaceae bacterium]
MNRFRYFSILLLLLCSIGQLHAIECGADQIGKVASLLEGKRVGLIINHTSVVGESQVCLLDTLLSLGIDVVRVFAPEHGFRGDADAGESVADGRDAKTNTPIISLYGANKRPSEEQLSGLDVVLFDIQDVGARFYTYISTMYYAMQSCSLYGVSMIVLDRPNPNDYVDGPIISDDLFSFVGALPIPILHGLTVAELACMINGEGWCGQLPVDLSVVPIVGWSHGKEYVLPIKPSPNLPNAQAIALYPSLCLFEATKVSVGRGTYMPFQILGFPDPKFGSFEFTPQPLAGFDKNPLQKGKRCYGVDLRNARPPKGFSLQYFIDFMQRSSQGAAFISSTQLFNMLSGDKELKGMLVAGMSEEQIKATWAEELAEYRKMRKKYLLYPDYLGE